MSSKLWIRIGTACIGGSALVGAVWFLKREGVWLLSAILALGSSYEYIKMVFSNQKKLLWLQMGFLIVLYSALFLKKTLFLGGWILWFQISVCWMLFQKNQVACAYEKVFQKGSAWVAGCFFYGFFPWFLFKSFQNKGDLLLLFWFFSVIWGTDTFAYGVGKMFGKHLLSPISPKKTWEGAIGGLLGAVCISFLWNVFLKTTVFPSLFFAFFLSLLGQIGDLFESFLKRTFQKKDSGTFLPGHGGWMDRFDSFLFALPWLYIWTLI